MIRQANGERDDRERRIRETRRRKDRASGHVEVVSAVHAAIAVHDAPAWINTDAGSARVVMRVRIGKHFVRDLHVTQIE